MDFTKDELSLITIYNTGDREGTMEEIEEIRTYLEDDEAELADLTASALRKLDSISDEEFEKKKMTLVEPMELIGRRLYRSRIYITPSKKYSLLSLFLMFI